MERNVRLRVLKKEGEKVKDMRGRYVKWVSKLFSKDINF
jgi:hypothetical protein